MAAQLTPAAFVVDDIWTQNSKFRRDKSLKLLSKIYKNIKSNPNNVKYRRLNISKIMSKPDIIPQVRQLLLISGFKPNKNGIHIDLNDADLNLCISVGDILENGINEESNKLEQERQKIKQKTKEKQAKYLQKSNQRKNELINKIQNEKKDIAKDKELGFKVIQNTTNTEIKPIKHYNPSQHNKIHINNNNNNNNDTNNRSKWIIGSKCQIYSIVKEKWLNGRIIEIDEEDTDLLTVQYMGFKTKQFKRNNEYIREIPKVKSTFVKDPEIMDKWYNAAIEYWWRMSRINKKKDININRLIIIFAINAYRLILTKDKEYYDNQRRQRQIRYHHATNNRDISMKISQKNQVDNWEREQLYNKLTNGIYKTQQKYNETRLPVPVSGINFKKEYVLLITNRMVGAQLLHDYEMNNDAKEIIFTVSVDMVKMGMDDADRDRMMRRRFMNQDYYNNLWCVAIPTLFKFERLAIKTMVKRIKRVKKEKKNVVVPSHGNPMIMNNHYDEDEDDEDEDVSDDDDDNDYDDPMNDHNIRPIPFGHNMNMNMMAGMYGRNMQRGYGYNDGTGNDEMVYGGNDEDGNYPPTEVVEKIIYIDVKSGDVIKEKKNDDGDEEQRENEDIVAL